MMKFTIIQAPSGWWHAYDVHDTHIACDSFLWLVKLKLRLYARSERRWATRRAKHQTRLEYEA